MRHETLNQETTVRALANFLRVKYSEAQDMIDNGTYEVLTEDEIHDKATDEIRNTLWAFRYHFLASNSDIIADIPQKSWEAMVSSLCEDANDAIFGMIEAGVGFESFVDEAILTDGIGHFTSYYDGEAYDTDDVCNCNLDERYFIIQVQ